MDQDDLRGQVQSLKRSLRQQQFVTLALCLAVIGGAIWVGRRSPRDLTLDTLTVKNWRVIDENGKTRIAANTEANGRAGIVWFDKDGKGRIGANTFAEGVAGVVCVDKDGKTRIQVVTEGERKAGVYWLDKDDKIRISAGTLASEWAGILWTDENGNNRIAATMNAGGLCAVDLSDKYGKVRRLMGTIDNQMVIYPTRSGN